MTSTVSISLDGLAPSLPMPTRRRRIREQASLRLADLANALNVDISTVSRWERGQVEPRGSARLLYAALLVRLSTRTQVRNNDTPLAGTGGASNKTDVGGLDASPYRRS